MQRAGGRCKPADGAVISTSVASGEEPEGGARYRADREAAKGFAAIWVATRKVPFVPCLGGRFFYFLPELLLIYMNERDNRNMLTEIKLIYQALEVQIRAGIYVADALTECCQSVKGRRLQQALIELAGDLVMQSDLMTALSAFQGKFDNRQIDALCITLIQAGESGQAVELLGDMGEQLKDMEITVLNHQKNALDRSITFYQLGMLGATLGVILYACVGYMLRAAVKF